MENHQIIDATTRFSTDDEKEVIQRAQQGNKQAFHQLYLDYHKKIYALCWRMLANKDSAEDVAQEVFVQLWKNISNFRGDSKFSTWLHSLATNVILGHLRKHKNWLSRVFSIEDQGCDEASEEMQDLGGLDKHIMRLPERARLVFVLFAVEGYRHEEIAKMLNMAVGSSKSQYHRARQLLQDWLQEAV